jgi:putative tryptophan/tyrosine transport system substrate-binding protein
MKRLAKELVALQLDVILNAKHARRRGDAGTNTYHSRRFLVSCRSCGSGYVVSLSRPGGNATGFSPIAGSLGGK